MICLTNFQFLGRCAIFFVLGFFSCGCFWDYCDKGRVKWSTIALAVLSMVIPALFIVRP